MTFDIGTDMNSAVVKVQNRVALAMPQLPTQVQNQGITIRKRTPDMLMIVNLFSPDGRYDDIYLSNYATIQVRDELLRVAGVSDITYQGERDYSIRVWLDPQKMAACNITATDVANAVRNQNLDAPAGRIGQPPSPTRQAFELPLDTLGRLSSPEQFGDIVVKVAMSGAPPLPTAGGGAAPGQRRHAEPRLAKQRDNGGSGRRQRLRRYGTRTTAPRRRRTARPATRRPRTVQRHSGGGSTGGGAMSGGGGTSGGGGSTGGSGRRGRQAAPCRRRRNRAAVPAGRCPGMVRVRDVARVELGAQNYNQSCLFDGQPAVGLSIYQLPGTNALDVADAVRKKMEELKSPLSRRRGLRRRLRHHAVRPRVDRRRGAARMFEAVALVGLVVLVFLQDWKAMVLPMIDVPVSSSAPLP